MVYIKSILVYAMVMGFIFSNKHHRGAQAPHILGALSQDLRGIRLLALQLVCPGSCVSGDIRERP